MFRNAAEIQRSVLGLDKEQKHIRPKTAETSAAAALSGPKVVLVGDTRATDEVRQQLRLITSGVRKVTTLKELVNIPIGSVDCVVIAGPIGNYYLVDLVEDLMEMGLTKPVPVFMVLPHWTDDETTRTLYELGVRFIFEWPTEKERFPFIVKKLLSIEPEPGQLESREDALKKALELRMEVLGERLCDRLDVHVYNRMAMLEGEMRSPERRQWVKRELERAPGIDSISVRGVKVSPESQS